MWVLTLYRRNNLTGHKKTPRDGGAKKMEDIYRL